MSDSAHCLRKQARTNEEQTLPTQQDKSPQILVTYDSEGISLKPLLTVRRQDGTSNLNQDVPEEHTANSKPSEEIGEFISGPVLEKKVSKHSIKSMRNDESGYITGTSQRNSRCEDDESIHQYCYTSSTILPEIPEKKKSIERPNELQILSASVETSFDSAGSSGSSQYVTAQTSAHSSIDFELDAERNASDKINSDSQTMGGCGGAERWITSLEIKTNDSKIDKDISTQHSKDSCIQLDSVEQDSPYPRKDRRPSLGKSASIEVCPSCRNPLKRMPRRSSTESSLSEATIRVAIEKLESQLGENAEVILKWCVKQHAADFRNYTDFTMLVIHLHSENLVHSGEKEYLNSPYHTQVQKANRFYLEILDRKGPEAYRSFYYALKAEKKHKGHEDLLKKLEQALDELCKP